MSGPSFGRPRGIRQGAALALVLGAVVAAGTATGTWDDPPQHPVPLTSDTVADSEQRDTSGSRDSPGSDPSTALSEALDRGNVAPDDAKALVSRSGDRWASYYTEQEYEDFQKTLDGEYVGVGVWVRRTGAGRIQVSQVQSGGPADQAEVRPGDWLTRIDGRPVTGRPVTDVVRLLRGEDEVRAGAGSPVSLGLERDGRSRDVVLRRAVLTAKGVSVGKLAPGITRIKVTSFTRGVGEQVQGAMRRVRSRPDADRGGVVLDLRGNPGGLVDEATRTASAFLDGGLVATYDALGEQRALFAEAGGDTRTPLVVLVDGGTMSAAEMLAGALQDRGRAVLVGSRTFGKGSVQEPSTLSDGSVVEATVGRYRTPSGRTVDGSGVWPDLEVDAGLGPGAAQQQACMVLRGLGTRKDTDARGGPVPPG